MNADQTTEANDARQLAEVTGAWLNASIHEIRTSGRGPFPVTIADLIGLERMALDLETLRTEMQAHLQETGMPVFHGYHRMLDTLAQVSWDTERHPDFREFLGTARAAKAGVVVFNYESFSLDQIDDALDQLEDSDFTRDEKRNYETRLRQLQAYEGFTCSVQLSFSLDSRLYVFELHTDWYQALAEIVNELDVAAEEHEDEEQGPIGGYFSNN